MKIYARYGKSLTWWIFSVIFLANIPAAAFCQDTLRIGLKGMALGIQFNPFNIGNAIFSGKYWLNEQQTIFAGLGFTISDNRSIYRRDTTTIATVHSYFSNVNLIVGTEYHFTRGQALSPFARCAFGIYTNTVPGYNQSKLFDSGGLFLYPGLGLEYFVTPKISLSVLQSIDVSYGWGSGVQAPNNPQLLTDNYGIRIQAASTNFLLNIYF